MIQPSTTPVPDHGTGWGLLLLFVYLYGAVAILGLATIVATALQYVDRDVPRPLDYLSVALLLGALGISLFTLLVAARAQLYDVLGLLLLVVFLPLGYVVVRRRGTDVSRLAITAHAALVWSLPFLVGFGVIAVGGTVAGGLPPEVTGPLAVIIVVVGTVILDRRPVYSPIE